MSTVVWVAARLNEETILIRSKSVQTLESQINDLVLVPRPASVLTLSHGNSVVRAWQALDGSLLWERVISQYPSSTGGLLVLPESAGEASRVIVFSGSAIEVTHKSTAWTSSNPEGNNCHTVPAQGGRLLRQH